MFRARLERAWGPEAKELSEEVIARLETLDELVSRWGQAVRLVGFKTPRERDRRYFAEALAVLRWLPNAGHALDIGSGGGSPALPLAIARPAVKWTLVEANERKALFLEEAVRALSLRHVTVLHARYEAVEPPLRFDVVTVRGVAVGRATLEKVARELGPGGGRLLWMSSEAVLTAGRDALGRAWAHCAGPIPLVRDGAFLLVAGVRS
jgi:16S rRNA (guanine527-N7)-methyltransferase